MRKTKSVATTNAATTMQRGHDAQDADAPHPPGDRAERAAVVVVAVSAAVAGVGLGRVVVGGGAVVRGCGVEIAHRCLLRTSGGHCPMTRTP